MSAKKQKTIVGAIDPAVLAYTAGEDIRLDRALVEVDCLGSAAHARMLAGMPLKPALLSKKQLDALTKALVDIIRQSRAGRFKITLKDQDVHLAVERALTAACGEAGKIIHTGRSRNDQVAVDLRLFAREQLLQAIEEAVTLGTTLLRFARKHRNVPMVGRTHMQPAMPSSVGLWASAYTESLLEDIVLLMNAYELNDQCPLGSAAGYGVPLPIDRQKVSNLLGFSQPLHNVIHVGSTRGKMESIILSAMSQVMLTLSRFAQDLILFTMPEFGYFNLPAEYCTGSSIMPQKRNPDVLELVRAKASRVKACELTVFELLKSLPSGYNRDVQEAKAPFMEGIEVTRASLQVLHLLAGGLTVNRDRLTEGFDAGVFATDRAIELVSQGMPFRDAYQHVKAHLDELGQSDPGAALAAKTHLGATAGLDFDAYRVRLREAGSFVKDERRQQHRVYSRLLGIRYPADLEA